MREWVLEYLRCLDIEIRVSKWDRWTGEPYSGIIKCDNKTYYIRRGIAILLDIKTDPVSRIKGLYEALPAAPWKASRSDWIRHMRYIHLRMLIDALMANKKRREGTPNILALGCGWGWEAWALRALLKKLNYKHFRIIGIDIANKPLKLARKLLREMREENIDFMVSPAERLPFKNASFDFVTGLFGVLDHSKVYPLIFKEVSRVLNPGGIFVFTVLNKFALDWMIKVIKNPRLYIKTVKKAKDPFTRVTIPLPKGGSIRIPTHYYNPTEVGKLVRKYGFEKIRAYGLFSILPMNFKKKKFDLHHEALSKLERRICDVFPVYLFGRYLGMIVKKTSQ